VHALLAGKIQDPSEGSTTRSLRLLEPALPPTSTTLTPKDPMRSHEITELLAKAEALGLSLMPTERLIKSLGASIAMRLTPRAGKNIYQTAE
jgi:hypothetical protein